MSVCARAPNRRPPFLPGAKWIVAIAALFDLEPARASFGGGSFGDGFAMVLGLVFVMPPFLVAILTAALTPRRRAAIPAGIVAGLAVSMAVFVVLGARGLDALAFAALGAVAGLVGGTLAWLWRAAWSSIARMGSAGNGERPMEIDPPPLAGALWGGAVSWFTHLRAWARRAWMSALEFGADLKSAAPVGGSAARPALRERLGYSAMLILAGLALSPITFINLTERIASSSAPSWLTALLVAIATGPPLLRVAPSVLDVLAAALIGPWWGAGVMLVIAGLLSPYFAGYPVLPYASVFGVMVAGLIYRATGNVLYVVLGEIAGAGVIGASVNAALGIYATDTAFDWPGWVAIQFLPISIGAVLGGVALFVMRQAGRRL